MPPTPPVSLIGSVALVCSAEPQHLRPLLYLKQFVSTAQIFFLVRALTFLYNSDATRLSASSSRIPSSTDQEGSDHSNAAAFRDIGTFHIGPISYLQQESPHLIPSKNSSSPSPFHRLPSELLIAVFEEGVSSSPRYRERDLPFPVIVFHVCRCWRDTALDTATLWTDTHIDDSRLAHTCQISRMYLARSKSTLIDVSFYCYRYELSLITAIMADILPHMGRVRRLTLILEHEKALFAVMDTFKHVVAPRLESLWISLLGFPLSDVALANDSLPLFTYDAPFLRSIKFYGVQFIAQPQFTQLTSLSLGMPMSIMMIVFREFLDLLSNISQTLIRLRVWEVNLEPGPAGSNLPPIELPRLQSLNLSQVDLFPFVHSLHLQSLYLYVVHSVSMETFLKRCSSFELSELQSLKFDQLDLSIFKSQMAVVHGLPLLIELVFWNCQNKHAFLSLLDKDSLASDQSKEESRAKENKGRQASTDSAMVAPAWSSSLPKGEIMSRLHSLTVSDDLCWPWLREILVNRILRGISIKRVMRMISRDSQRQ